MSDLNTDGLNHVVKREIRAAGGIPFQRYMELALYHPEYGYYAAEQSRIGKQGDFFTSSSVHSSFGRLIARQLEQMWRLLGGGAFTLVEQGSGDGHLCLDILSALEEEFPDFYPLIDYRLVEVSNAARQRQAELLERHRTSGRVSWAEFEELEKLHGCWLSNELIDAFPVHLVEMSGGELHEVFVVTRGSVLTEELRPLSTPRLADYFSAAGILPVEGQRCEVNLAACQWMRHVAAKLERGFVLTIDYGYPDRELYAPWRQNGTLLCFHQHQTSDNPYRLIGEQDITSHVDFSMLQRIGLQGGLETRYFGLQYQFLLGLGFLELLLQLQAREQDDKKAQALRMTLKNLVLPEAGMGESFKVLVQAKNVPTGELLCQRKINDIRLPAGRW